MLAFILTVVTAYIVYALVSFYRNVSKLPPGPTPLPLIGNLLTNLNPPFLFRDLERIAKEYGNVHTVYFPFPVVNVSDYETLKDVLRSEDFTGRFHPALMDIVNFSKGARIINADGEIWKEQRRVAITILRDFGMGRNLMEEKVHLSAELYIECLKSKKDFDRVDMRWTIQLFVANVISDLLFAKRYPGDDCKELIDFVEGIVNFFIGASKSKMLLAGMWFPILKHIPVLKEYAFDMHERNFSKMKKYVKQQVDEDRKTFNEEDEPLSFTHAYMKAMRTNTMLNEQQLYDCCKDLFLAGQETTTTTLRWAMLFIAAHQDVQASNMYRTWQ